MVTAKVLFLFLAVFATKQTSLAEHCIDYEEHKNEIMTCCRYPQPFPYGGNSMKECTQKAQNIRDVKTQTELYECIFECFYQKLGLTNKRDPLKINMDKLTELIRAKSLSEEFQNVILNAFKRAEKVSRETNHEYSACNPFALGVSVRATKMIHVGCTDEYFHAESEICKRLKNGEPWCPVTD